MFDHPTRSSRLAHWLRSLLADVHYAVRQLASRPGFTLTAVLSLALGIGANTAIFSIVNAVLLRALPVENPQKLAQVRVGENDSFTTAIWEQFRDHQQFFSGSLAYNTDQFNLADGGERQLAEGLKVSGDYFRVLGVPAAKGRVFSAADDRRGLGSNGSIAVISHQFWQKHFAGDADVIGKTVQLNRHTFQVVGVTPPWFAGLDLDHNFEIAIPLACETTVHENSISLDNRHVWWLRILGRIPADKDLQQSEAALKVLTPQVLQAAVATDASTESRAEFLKMPLTLAKASTGFSSTGDQYRTALYTLMATVALVLLIACANIANLLLARATARQKELSVRMAVGASRWRLIRQLMTESLLLALLGAGAGLLVALWGSDLLVGMLSTGGQRLDFDLSIDARVFTFTLGATVITALLFGLIPALRATRIDLNTMLKENARGSTQGRSRFGVGQMLMVGQVGLSLILLVGSGLFIGTLRNLLKIDPGFDANHVLLVNLDIEHSGIDKTRRAATYHELREQFRNIAGVESASSSFTMAATGAVWDDDLYPQGQAAAATEHTVAFINRISPGFLKTMKISLVAGREFSEADTLTAPRVMIIGQRLAQEIFGQANPIGQTIGMRGSKPDARDMYQIIGVAKDVKYNRLDEKTVRAAYLSALQDEVPATQMFFEIRTTVPAADVLPAIRATAARIDPAISMRFRDYPAQLNELLQQPKIMAVLSAIFGALAALLAMIGLYGTTSYAVAQRQSEIGIRMALGAQRHNVLKLIVRQGMAPALVGIAVGVIGALALTRIVESLLFGVHPSDPSTFISMALLMGAVALIACALPARRASMLDPMTALRND